MSFQIFRKVLLINKPFQYSIIGWFIFFSMFNVVISFFGIWLFFEQMSAEALSIGLPPDHVFFRFVVEQKTNLYKIFILASAFSTALIFVGGLYISNKVAGPIYRLTQFMLHKKIDDAGPINFRKGDYFPELKEAFNKFISKD